MEFDIGGRAGGKTYRLVEWLKQDPKHHRMLVANQQHVVYVRQQYLGLPAGSVISPLDIVRGGQLHPNSGIAMGVDNLDLILPLLLHCQVERVTATGVLVPGYHGDQNDLSFPPLVPVNPPKDTKPL